MDSQKYVSLIGQSISPRKKLSWILMCIVMNSSVYNVIQFFQIFKKLNWTRKFFRKNQSTRDHQNQKRVISSSKMIDISKYLLYLQEQQALICRSCKYCLQPNGIENHLQRKHSAIPLKVRKELVSYAESLILRNPSEVVTPVTVMTPLLIV